MKKNILNITIGIIIIIAGIVLLGGIFFKEIITDTKDIGDGKLNEIESQSLSLGNLCSGEQSCKDFCSNNRAQCESYCKGNENELCRIIFPSSDNGWETGSINERDDRQEKECEGTKIKFDYPPVNLDKTKVMLPRGLMTGDHVTPVNHHYFQNFDNTEYDIEVYSPGNGYLTAIGLMPGAEEGKDYHITIQHTCTISSQYIYVSDLPEKIYNHIRGKQYASVRIPVEAGELIGYYKSNLDYNIIDEEVILTGFAVPEHYAVESYKIHIVPDTYDYFNEPVKNKLIEKSVRTAEPISGKIDYDVDGRLVGNWFLEGTNGYAGAVTETGSGGYWAGHLAIVYDYLDPERIVISIASYDEQDSRQFSVKTNSPDPAEVSVETGLVKYELVEYDYITSSGSSWDRISPAKILRTEPNNNVQGVVLVQMIEPRQIKFEAFPGKTASQVSGFTEQAKIYMR